MVVSGGGRWREVVIGGGGRILAIDWVVIRSRKRGIVGIGGVPTDGGSEKKAREAHGGGLVV